MLSSASAPPTRTVPFWHRRDFCGLVWQLDPAAPWARRCSHPGCDVSATFSDVDHIDEWARSDGATVQRNADIQCGKHDRFKHRERWRTRRSTTGRPYSIRPDGTIVLAVGERPPDITIDESQRIARHRLAALTS